MTSPITDTTGIPSYADITKKSPRDFSIKEAAQSFESFFIYMMLKEMRKGQSLSEESADRSGFGKETYQAMFDEAVASEMTHAGGIGVADFIIKNMK